MARARNIKPGFFANDLLAEVAPLGRLLFAGLWAIADRSGRLEDRPKRIKAMVLPYDDCDVDDLMEQLADRGFITRYCAAGESFIEVTNFTKHQNPHLKEAQSVIPAPDKQHAGPVPISDKHGTSPADSLTPSTDSVTPILVEATYLQPASDAIDKDFELFWQQYPRKVDKRKAEKAWQKIRPADALLENLMAALARQKASAQWQKNNGQFVPHPSTWLNGCRWEDQVEPDLACPSGSAALANQNYNEGINNDGSF